MLYDLYLLADDILFMLEIGKTNYYQSKTQSYVSNSKKLDWATNSSKSYIQTCNILPSPLGTPSATFTL